MKSARGRILQGGPPRTIRGPGDIGDKGLGDSQPPKWSATADLQMFMSTYGNQDLQYRNILFTLIFGNDIV